MIYFHGYFICQNIQSMKNTLSSITLVLFALIPQANSAVHLSSSKTGQAIIVPFYTASNQMNTLLSLNNTTDDNKAVKIHFKEAKNGDLLASFNIYLTGQDMWTMGMGQVPSIDGGRLRMISSDQSCTVGFPNNEDIAIEESWLWENGTIEIIEMGTVDHFEAPANFRDCEYIAQLWETGQAWAEDSERVMSAATGGLHAEVTLMDVEQGHSANIPIIHMDGFYGDDDIQHTAAGEPTPNLATGTKDSLVLYDGQAISTTWPTGYEAVSALLMKNTLTNEFNLEPEVAAQTEFITSFPTLHYHLHNESSQVPFFTSTYNPEYFKFPYFFSHSIGYFDREAKLDLYQCFVGICPPNPGDFIKGSVVGFIANNHMSVQENYSNILFSDQSENTYYFYTPFNIFYSGKFLLQLGPNRDQSKKNDRGHDTTLPEVTHEFHGLPVIGFVYSRFSNSNAQPGLLAQYAFVRKHFGEKKVVIGDAQ